MDDAGAVRGGDVVAADDEVRPLVRRHEVERRLVLEPEQLGAGELAFDDGLLAEDLLGEIAGEHEALAAALDQGVGDLGVDGRGDVADQRPRRGGPDGERDALAGLARQPCRGGVREREAHVDRVLGDVLVALRHLVAADRRAAARAVGHDLVALVQQPAVPDLAEDPPHRLDVVVGEGVVGIIEVDPEPDALREALPLLEIRGDALAAQLVELGDAVGLDLPLAVDAETALDLQLDRQAVGVPAALARHAVAAHRLVAREEVLEDARDDVVRARAAVGRRRPFVEDVEGRVVAALEALLEDAVVFPERQDARVERREVDARRDVLEPGLTVAHVTRFLLLRTGLTILPDAAGPPRHGRPASPRPAHPITAALPHKGRGRRARPRPCTLSP